ncbi:MAG: hypothetical protein ACJ76J_30310 [Thermoanaerobaculia bacterium]
MEHAAMSPLAAWESFYVIVGSSAAALTGLQFVVIVLGAEVRALVDSTMRAFATPTVVHFCAVLLISAVLSAPWAGLGSAGLCLGLCGVAGLVYVALVIRETLRQKAYVPVLEDWLWHTVFPLLAYVSLLAAGLELRRHPAPSLFVIGGAALLLLFIGIHNAWDAVTYIALQRRPEGREDQK